MKILIPIKEKSERLPFKNFRYFCGIPLYQYSLRQWAKRYKKGLYVNTDSDEIIQYCNKHNINVIERKEELRNPDESMNNIIKDFLDDYVEDDNEIIIQSHVTSPFVFYKEFALSFIGFYHVLGDNYDSAFSVDRCANRYWNVNKKPINHKLNDKPDTKGVKPIYLENSALYGFTKKSFNKNNNRIGKKPFMFIAESCQGMDIDTGQDFKLCELVAREMNNGNWNRNLSE